MINIDANTVINRFFRYIKIDTQSDVNTISTPSTAKQFDLANVLVEELKQLGVEDVELDSKCYLMATLPSNTGKEVQTIGLIAHLDTSPDFSGKDVKPKITANYDGNDIVLNEKKNIILSPSEFPELLSYKGQDIISTDGTSLLGADDKAGITAIMTAIEYLKQNPQIKHGKIRICFTPDEEIGKGADHFDVEKFGADFAYTIDGGEIGQLEFENFNAAGAKVQFNGQNVHPGTSKNKMINSMNVAMEFHSLLPHVARPEHTEGYEGFFHLMKFLGSVEKTILEYIIRDHSKEKFAKQKVLMQNAADYINSKHGENTIQLTITEQYLNMRTKIEPVMHIVDLAEKAMIDVEVEPLRTAIRGGTDGARLSYMGLPTPNIFTGGSNFHSKFEFIPVQSLQKSTEVIVRICESII